MSDQLKTKDVEQIKLENEVRKSIIDFYKYLGTLNTGMIVITGSLYNILFPSPVGVVPLVIVVSLICFLFSAVMTLSGILLALPEIETPKLLSGIAEGVGGCLVVSLATGLFILGVSLFVAAIFISNALL